MRVRVADDEELLADTVAVGLRRQGMAVAVCYDGDDAHERLSVNRYDVAVLDPDMPGQTGEVCRAVHSLGLDTRIQLLTAAASVRDRVEGLSLGADDYLTKPFAFAELVARVHAIGRRSAAVVPPASHELRTPLAVQRTLIEVGLEGPLSSEQLNLLTTQLLTTNERNERLVEGRLVLARPNRPRCSAHLSASTRSPRRLSRRYQPRAKTAGIELSVTTRPTTIAGEQVLAERLVGNLVRNAIAYNVAVDGWVEVQAEQRTITVTNTGPRVPAEDVGLLFEPFRRGRVKRPANAGGAGLGLTICRAIATAHDASITAAPGPSGGLVVKVVFPPEP